MFIVNNGQITANGGDGGTPIAGNCGGGGTIVIYSLTSMTGSGSTSVVGGNGGSSAGTGTAGSSGGAGQVAQYILV
ncbi:hypothetical protein JNM87_05430 [Candidatus Saccharibacteria bacterium]|nr:hypothetical protein [Candidatus Saccharibacteria bacterium]